MADAAGVRGTLRSMDSPPLLARRVPVGIADAVTLLALALAGWWFVAPVPAARSAAAREVDAIVALDAIAAAADAWGASHGGRFADLDTLAGADPSLAARLTPSGVAGVRGAGAHWFAVLLPSREGLAVLPADGDPSLADRGYLVLSWPRAGAHRDLRALVACADGMLWQRGGDPGGSGDPADPPLPRTAFASRGDGPAEPPPMPQDWVVMRKRRRGPPPAGGK